MRSTRGGEIEVDCFSSSKKHTSIFSHYPDYHFASIPQCWLKDFSIDLQQGETDNERNGDFVN